MKRVIENGPCCVIPKINRLSSKCFCCELFYTELCIINPFAEHIERWTSFLNRHWIMFICHSSPSSAQILLDMFLCFLELIHIRAGKSQMNKPEQQNLQFINTYFIQDHKKNLNHVHNRNRIREADRAMW
jgi:hypothetical protein